MITIIVYANVWLTSALVDGNVLFVARGLFNDGFVAVAADLATLGRGHERRLHSTSIVPETSEHAHAQQHAHGNQRCQA